VWGEEETENSKSLIVTQNDNRLTRSFRCWKTIENRVPE